jgi:nicotinate-nucleotide adenylyltransferase
MKKKRIGILGGTFNPVHMGHLRTAEEVKENLALDEVHFIPSFNPPFAKHGLASFSDRLKMVRTAIRGNPFFAVTDIESKIPGRSYTAHTIHAFMREHPKDRIFFIMGADTFLELPKWYKPEEVIGKVEVVVILRPPYNIERLMKIPFLKREQRNKLKSVESRKKVSLLTNVGKRRIVFLRTTPLDISATYIRNQIKKGKSVKYLLPQKVESYIISNKLYH